MSGKPLKQAFFRDVDNVDSVDNDIPIRLKSD